MIGHCIRPCDDAEGGRFFILSLVLVIDLSESQN